VRPHRRRPQTGCGCGGQACELELDPRQKLSGPPKLTFEQIKEFTLYASRTILSGRADEIVELAKTNLRDVGVE
jgi:hypothetical protein